MNTHFDLAIVGGGAAGMAAAIEMARIAPTARVIVLEKLPRLGKKLLATGNGRCNLGHTPIELSRYHGSVAPTAPFSACGDTVDFFRSLGLLTRTDEAGRIYPLSNQASAVLDALRFGLEQSKTTVCCGETVHALKPKQGGFSLATDTLRLYAKKVLITAGGTAAPSFGTDGNLFALLEKLGHHVTPLLPALCPIPTAPLRGLKGLRVQTTCTAWRQGQALATELGEVQFGERALSGICIFNLARLQADCITLDLLPTYTINQAATLLQVTAETRRMCSPEDWLTGLFPKRVAQLLLKELLTVPLDRPVPLPDNASWRQLATHCKAWSFPVTGQAEWAQAQTTAGGIPANELTEELESTCCKGLYFAGEVVDLDGDCGGYNLHWAWASGRFAAQCATNGAFL